MGEELMITMEPGKEKLIVMPFCPKGEQSPGGKGLGLHFLAGNLICLHQDLLECWFGWRVKKIFPEQETLLSYCSGEGPGVDIQALGEQEKVRFWIDGEYAEDRGRGVLCARLHDTRDHRVFRAELAYAYEDGFSEFRSGFFYWLVQTGLGFSGREAGQWPERISAPGLDALGKALETLYAGYVGGGGENPAMDLSYFRQAVAESPGSYLAQDLLGWGLYKNNDIDGAKGAFDAALASNPDGMGAHAGQMWIALAQKDEQTALHHAIEKGRCRGEDPEKARAFVAKKMG